MARASRKGLMSECPGWMTERKCLERGLLAQRPALVETGCRRVRSHWAEVLLETEGDH